MAAASAPDDDAGYFRLPDSGGDDTKSLEFIQEELEAPNPSIMRDKQRVLSALLKAFDNLQDFEIRDMNELIFLGKTAEHLRCQQNLLRLTRQCEELQAAVNDPSELPFGQIEYMEDAYRSLMSELRMYAKDADFFLPSGGVVEPSQRGFAARIKWPWAK